MAQKSAKKSETISFLSPFGTARFPKLNKPDTEGTYADGKFKTQLVLDEADVAAVRETFIEAAKKLHPKVAIEDVKLPLKEFFNKDEKGERTVSAGEGFEAKTKKRPVVMDAKKQKLSEGVIIGGGSVIRISGAIAAYSREVEETIIEGKTKRKQKGVEHGLTIYLNAVQVKSLSQGQSDGSEFDAVEGFEYEGGEDTAVGADDATAF